MRVIRARAPALWAGFVVRMNWSYETSSRSHMAWKRPAISSTNACGVTPRSAAACATFWPCSSIPVRKWTASPRSRWYRAITSAPIFSYAWPMCGSPLA